VVTGEAQCAGALPDDVYRTCDADVQLPSHMGQPVAMAITVEMAFTLR
jgi:hypothetical protein